MKYIIVRQSNDNFHMNTIRPIEDKEKFILSGFSVVGEYKTKAIATKALNDMGGWIVIA